MGDDLAAGVDRDGFAIVPDVVAADAIEGILAALQDAPHAIRDLIGAVPAVADLARRPEIRGLAGAVIGPGAFVARAILFDKTPGANWRVAWHQDATIATRSRREVDGFGPWSEKAGIPHVRPPAAILGRMVTLRVHLDPCGPEDGPLRVIPGSHLSGLLSAEEIAEARGRSPELVCAADRGGVVLMRPLILHASSSASAPRHRSVVHLEFPAEDLPGGLEWHGRW